MSWRDALRPGSFRGVPFEVEADKVPVGRRTVTHEYPGKDRPYVEDMGRVTREHKVTAFVIGPDCLEQRDALLEALETEGPGELVHPWLGTLRVTAGVGEMVHAYAEGGLVRFELTFTESPELTYPAGVANTGKLAAASGANLLDSAMSRYSTALSYINLAQTSAGQLIKGVQGILDVVQEYAAPIYFALGTVQNLAGLLVNAPGDLIGIIRGVFTSAGGALHSFDGFSLGIGSLLGKTEAVRRLAEIPVPQGQETAALQLAAVSLLQDVILADTVIEAGEIPIVTPIPAPAAVPAVEVQVLQPIALPDTPVADDVLELREAVTEALWTQTLTAPQSHFQALTEARIQTGRHLLAVARQGVRLVTVTPAQPMPSLVLAYGRYGDATRAAEVVARNRVAHPGFVPAAPLQVAAS